jgi:4-amino-4-deoxy-L-arabinose transferase-like glycosyltransferase
MQLSATTRPLATSPGGPSSLVRSYLIVFVGALAIGLAMVFVGFHLQTLVDTKFDPYDFGAMGKSLVEGHGFAPFGNLIERRAPLYPIMIAGIYFLFGEQSTLVLIAQAFLLAASCVVVFDIGRRVFNVRTGYIAAVLCALNPMLLRYVGDLQLETLLTFLFVASLWTTVRFVERPSLSWGILLGACIALACLTKSVALPYPFLFAGGVLLIAWLRRRRGQPARVPWAPLASIFLVMFALIAPWTARNWVATGGHFVLLSSGTSDAFLRGYIFSRPEFATLRQPPYTDAENQSNELFRGLARQAGTEWQANDYETDQILNRAAVQQLQASPTDFLRKFGTGLFTFWYEMTNLKNSLLAGGLALAAWLLAFVGLPRAWREGRPVWLFLLPVLYLNLALAVLLALGRYSVPVLPALLILAAFGVDTLLIRFRHERA